MNKRIKIKNRIHLKLFLVIIFLLGIFNSTIQAQSRVGIIGKRNEISVNTLGIGFYKTINFNYKFAVSKHFLLLGGFTATKMNTPFNLSPNLMYKGNSVHFPYKFNNFFSNDPITKKGFEIGYEFSSNNLGINLPLGYYMGMLYKRDWFDFTTTYNVTVDEENPFNIIKQPLEFNLKMHTTAYLIRLGKNTLLKKNFTLDVLVDLGFRTAGAKLISLNDNNFTITGISLYHKYDSRNLLDLQNNHKQLEINANQYSLNYIENLDLTAIGFGLVFIPQLRIGYIF